MSISITSPHSAMLLLLIIKSKSYGILLACKGLDSLTLEDGTDR